ncbi:Organic solute transporter subunit alpha/Transmembrane protein [Sesbania bispinosa]|nr:Organic solute transporter subunit alpha/Transmembrane protein [Sesbania bispinosa]
MALCALFLFYVACKDLLHPFNPVPKFIIIKSVVFLTYWQGVLVFLAAKSEFIKDADEAALLQNFIICVEMLVAAVGHFYAFPYKEYAGANIGGSRGLTASLSHALMLNDFYHDTVHQFAPTYHDYVLYNHGEGEEGPRKYRSRTFVPIGSEMETVRRNKHMVGNKFDDTQLSSLTSSNSSTPSHSGPISDVPHSGAVKSSLLVDVSNSVSVPYDFTLIDLDASDYPEKVPAADKAECHCLHFHLFTVSLYIFSLKCEFLLLECLLMLPDPPYIFLNVFYKGLGNTSGVFITVHVLFWYGPRQTLPKALGQAADDMDGSDPTLPKHQWSPQEEEDQEVIESTNPYRENLNQGMGSVMTVNPLFRGESLGYYYYPEQNYTMMEKRQLFLRSYQFCRKKSLTERIKGSLVRAKKVVWLRLRFARGLRKLVFFPAGSNAPSITVGEGFPRF